MGRDLIPTQKLERLDGCTVPIAMANLDDSQHFHCPKCGIGDFEVGHLTKPDEPYCLVCLEADDQQVLLQRWGAAPQARLRGALLAG
jgi:hypothetical protein